MTLERLDGPTPARPQRWWRRMLPGWPMRDRAPLWAWGSVAPSLLSFTSSLLGFNFTAIAFAASIAASLVVISLTITARKKAHTELERSEPRYRHLFSRMPIAFQQLDASRLVMLFRNLRREGVKDLGPYFDSHPEFLRTCMDALSFQEANERAIQIFGSTGSDFVGPSMAETWKERPDTFRRAMESRYRGETNFEEETQMVTCLPGKRPSRHPCRWTRSSAKRFSSLDTRWNPAA